MTNTNTSYYIKSERFLKWMLFTFLLINLSSCGKDSINLSWQEITMNQPSIDFNQVYFEDENIGHIVGGSTWNSGVHLRTLDGGASWVTSTITDKAFLTMDFVPNTNQAFIAGIDVNFHVLNTTDDNWYLWGIPLFFKVRDLAFRETYKGVLVGGEAFQFGKVITLGDNYQPIAQDSFVQELSAVAYVNDERIFAVGYGIVIISDDAGMSWNYTNVKNDFFRDIIFPTEDVGYIVGSSGSIIKTVNGGDTWETIRNGNKLSVSDEPFKAVFFENEEKGYIVGDQGLFWRTINGGKDWLVVADFPTINLKDIFVKNGKGYIVGEEGSLFTFED